MIARVGTVAAMPLLLWACGDLVAPTEDPASPQFAASGTPGEPWVAQVEGGLIFIDDQLAHRDISNPHVNVKLFSDGSVRGAVKGGRQFVDPIFADVPVLKFFNLTRPDNAACLVVEGNQVWIGIVDDGVIPFSPSGEFVFILVDNGDAGVDLAGAFVPATDCAVRPVPAFPFTTFLGGTLKIMQR